MTTKTIDSMLSRIARISRTFVFSPQTNYTTATSHSTAELLAKASQMTTRQMRMAVKSFETKHPDVARKIKQHTR
ncbi:hypothetical protein [Laribacter hongkongensis]|uniref:hypothetical protein n=1 Tax=Laribacter hongkongensis TaxID=168471 RepID=UPI0012DE858B|nr:hypothetical protein [Laribacter hongkongensis]